MMCRASALRFLACLTLVLLGTADQATAALPSAVDAGRLPDQLTQPLFPDIIPTQPVTPPPAPALQAPPAVRFVLKQVRLSGGTTLTDEELAQLIKPLLGQMVDLAALHNLADAITALYRQHGYLLSQAIVPAQQITDGIVTLELIEGFVARVMIQGPSNAVLDRLAERITGEKPLTLGTLDECLLRANLLPGLKVSGTLAPATDIAHAAELTLLVEDDQLAATLAVNNRGSYYVGRTQWQAGVDLQNIFGLAEATRLRFALSEPAGVLRYAALTQDIALGNAGTRLALDLDINTVKPGRELRDLPVHGKGYGAALRLSHPWIVNRHGMVTPFVELAAQNTESKVADDRKAAPAAQDRLRSIALGIQGQHNDNWLGDTWPARIDGGLILRQGIDGLGAADESRANPSRARGQNDFTKISGSLSRRQQLDALTPGLGLLLALDGQTSFGTILLAAEEYGVGGGQYGRGFAPSTITGESGLATKLELTYGQSLDWPWLTGWQIYGFQDFGLTADFGSDSPRAVKRLMSAGIGLRLFAADAGYAETELAQQLPLARLSNNERRPDRLVFSFNVGYRF